MAVPAVHAAAEGLRLRSGPCRGRGSSRQAGQEGGGGGALKNTGDG